MTLSNNYKTATSKDVITLSAPLTVHLAACPAHHDLILPGLRASLMTHLLSSMLVKRPSPLLRRVRVSKTTSVTLLPPFSGAHLVSLVDLDP